MSDNYQAVYDAVRSRFHGCDVGEAVQNAIRDTIGSESWRMEHIAQEFIAAGQEQQRPSVLMRPELSVDGKQWCALYGDNLQDGCAGFGDTPAAAMADFDKNWRSQVLAAAPSGGSEGAPASSTGEQHG